MHAHAGSRRRKAEWDFRSQDSDEIQEFLGVIYAENRFGVPGGRSRPSRTRIYGVGFGAVAQYDVSFSSPFTFLSETERESYLIVTCTAGMAKLHRNNEVIELGPGRTAAISATQESRVEGGRSLAHIATHISSEAIHSQCSRLLGRPLDAPVVFELVPFGDELKALWDMVVGSLGHLLASENPSDIAINSLNEYAISLLLERHPHNYSRSFGLREAVGTDLVRDARHFIEQNAHRNITVAEVAAFVGCGINALHGGFCEHLGLPLRACLHLARLASARSALTNEETGADRCAEDIARRHGFPKNFRDQHGDSLTDRLVRHLRALRIDSERCRGQRRGTLTPAKVDQLRHQINTSLGKRQTVETLAALVNMSPQSFAPAFKHAFKTTPAQYVLMERVKWARWLLENSEAKISAIAAETGFASQSHLTSSLKRLTGQTPRELRRLSRGR